ncbi:NAF1 domain-containing protein [Colletotrichum graminicola]|uniref:H/ACA ribonucleoprotein complex non-core subunit NAF1 n=1 Tax=Colletotrichum graminicola (strain M1.001 / M2 / FGSC 10212) TaxID=645133 RepID=E3QMK5_COLGM|nr:NAF1 domain-containing protein [Colletotrichum graminicola M1.001]EFQ32093.1 NAF1 domain-containing protein [Colletotrichum graminicola M1.001]WDK17016.1 NAF1 domain-containing protein [Colletotrichum graminicola]
MSGFQIPGLGFAKPNETLPPLPPDVLAAAASFEGIDTGTGVQAQKKEEKQEQTQEQNEDTTMGENTMETQPAAATAEAQPAAAPEQAQPSDPEAMNVDEATEQPSLTDALEAMIGGLDPTPPVQAPAAAQETPVAAAQDTSAPQPVEGANAAAAAVVVAVAAEQPAAVEQPPAAEGEHPEWEIDSSPYESSSESSSDDSSSDEESEAGGYQLLGVEETARMLMEMEGGSDDEGGNEGGKAGTSGHLRTKNEMVVETIPKPDVTLAADDKVEALGLVDQIVDNIMVIKAFTPGEYQVLDTGSVLCTEDRKVFGVVWETIGKVLQPMYTVMLSTADEIREAGLAVGAKVYYPPAHAKFVFTQPLKNLKGSDASNIHDEEVAEDEMEFSDDEKEAEHKKQVKQKKKEARFGKGGGGAEGRGRGGREPHPLRNEVSAPPVEGGLNYDDEDDGPYKPLARPPGFGQVPPTQQTFTTEPEPGRFGGRRGGRGDFRGRGDRGRGGRGRGRGGHGGRGGADHRDGYSAPPHQRHHSSQQEGGGGLQQPQGQWGGNGGYQAPPPPPPQQTVPAPAAPAFNFPFPGLPVQAGQQGFPAVPPPPPGWPAQGGQTAQNPQSGAYINPAFFAALLGQMQQNQGQQPPQQPQQPPQPPHPWGAQPPPR